VAGQTRIEIRGADFWLNDAPTYAGRTWAGQRIEGLLLNARMVQATFDDLNPDTRDRWAYPDTGRWDPERNVGEFLAMLPVYRQHGLLVRVRERAGGRLLVSTSYRGRGRVPDENVARVADFMLLHGNSTVDPALIAAQVERTRLVPGYRGQPIVFNEDDHFDFDRPSNNFTAAIGRGASWGYFDPGAGAGGAGARGDYVNGYQLVPVNWTINTPRKQAFFNLVAEITGARPTAT
jgi:hypothetical protein